jgi:hypothetical protein
MTMVISFVTDCIKSSESTLTTTDTPLTPTEITAMPLGWQKSEKDQDRRRKKAYKWYKHYAKPTKASMCSIVDYYANDTDITRQDVDLLPWNTEETEVIREVMKALKKRMKTETIDKKKEKEGKKEKKEKEHGVREDTASTKSNGYINRPTLLKGKDGNSSLKDSSGSLYAGSSSWDEDHTQENRISAEQLETIEVEKEQIKKVMKALKKKMKTEKKDKKEKEGNKKEKTGP